jgi:CDGSH-type Zn-finger protein
MKLGDVRITIIPDGPAKIEFARAEVVLPDGTIKKKKSDLFLCRCGQSSTKPLCDGTHKTCGFKG